MPPLHLRLTDAAVRWRFKRHADRPVDVAWVRERIGKPLWARRLITPPIERHVTAIGALRAEWLVPPPDIRGARGPERAVLYVHGGGYIACSPSTHRPLAARLAREWNAVALVPDYRLAPEYPYPAARDDVLAAWRYMLDALCIDPDHAVFAGDSAGGGLLVAAAIAARDAGLPLPGALVAFSPWADLTGTGTSVTENADRCAMFVPSQLHAVASLYAGATPRTDPGVSPARADLHGLPPLCVHVSNDELLRDDALLLAERAAAAGVTVALQRWDGVPHVWQFLAGFLPEARASLDAAAAFVRTHVPPGTVYIPDGRAVAR